MPGDLSDRIARWTTQRRKAVVAPFVILLLLALPVLLQMTVYINVYDVSPRTNYYPHYKTLNRRMGWDNLAFVLVTPNTTGDVVDPDAIREMDAVGKELEQLEYVEGTLSLATIVKVMHRQATGEFAMPPDNAAGDAMIRQYMDAALDQFGDRVIYGNLLSRDHGAGLMVVTMPTGVDIREYRDWNADLLDEGLRADEATSYAGATDMRPLSLDMIWIWVEKSTVQEGPTWVAFAGIVATISLYVLYRRLPEVFASVATLGIVMAVTVAGAYLAGVRFNLLSMIIMSLIFGLGVDYCMHVTSRYREERALGREAPEAVSAAVRNVGSALWMSAISTTIGFASLYFSLIPAIAKFGITLGVGIFTAFVASVTFLPALLSWIDDRRDEVPSEPYGEARAEAVERAVRDEQRASRMGRLGAWCQDHKVGVVASTLAVVALLMVPFFMSGVQVWTGSYTRPHTVLEEDLYPMTTLKKAERVFGIPVDMSVMVYGDATDPETVQMVRDLEQRLEGVHARMNTESIIFPLEYYLRFTQEGRMCNCDRDGDLIPDTSADLERAYAYLRDDPAMSLAVERVLTDEENITAIRVKIDPSGQGSDLGSDIANYRTARRQTERIVERFEERNPEATADVTFENTGLVVLGVETVDAIIRGNAASIAIMLSVIFAVITWFWRKPTLTLLTMVPVFLAILTQYSVTSALGYQVTYVSLIVTGGATGIGVDDGIHLVNRIREEITAGRDPRDAVNLATSEIGAVLAGTTATDISGFVLVVFSFVIWGAQTAIVMIPTLAAAFLATVVVMPALVGWHAARSPETYVQAGIDD